MSIESLSLLLMLAGIGLAFFNIRLSGWILGWILLSGALLLQGFRSMLSYIAARGGVDAATYATANDWMGLGFSLLIVAAMPMMREVFARHKQTTESLRIISAAANDAIIIIENTGSIAAWNLAAQDIFGYSEQEARGKKLWDLIVPQAQRVEFEGTFTQFGRDGRGYHLYQSPGHGGHGLRSGQLRRNAHHPGGEVAAESHRRGGRARAGQCPADQTGLRLDGPPGNQVSGMHDCQSGIQRLGVNGRGRAPDR